MPQQDQPATKADLEAFRQAIAADFARQLRDHQRHMLLAITDPALFAALNAPDDDEPYTEEQQRHDEEAHAAEGIPLEEIKRELGL